MPSTSSSVVVSLPAGQQMTLTTTGEAYADVLAGVIGAGFDSIRALPNRPRVIGPYGADASLRIRATGGTATYETRDPNPTAAAAVAGAFAQGSTIIGGLGDSITAQFTTTNGNGAQTEYRSKGFLTWLMILSDGALFTSRALNHGVSGQTSKQIADRSAAAAADMKSRGARYCTVHMGTNDLNDATVDEAQIVTNLSTACENLMKEGITPIVIPILPRFYDSGVVGTALTTERRLTLQRWARAQRNYTRSTPGALLCDPTIPFTDQSDALGYPIGREGSTNATMGKLAYTNDGLHPSPRGAFLIARMLLDLLKPRLSVIAPRVVSQADVYDATYNPGGNRFTNGFMKGTVAQSGTAAGTGATGVTNLRQSAGTGTVTVSKGTRTVQGVAMETQTCTTTGTGAAIELYRSYITINVTAGQLVEIDWALAVSNVTPGSLTKLEMFAACGTNWYAKRDETGLYQPDDAWAGTLTVPSFIAPVSGQMYVILEWGIDGTVTNAGAQIDTLRINVRVTDVA
ncbi:SGNH/GDSL hydrolase family protein [Massilia sp. METH4]|uniref:SGNH/GDSL hydrolase family protein n=1 Tax=Massilia sp. METH4 TaxID=3123041 RepID=UPI0030CABB3A